MAAQPSGSCMTHSSDSASISVVPEGCPETESVAELVNLSLASACAMRRSVVPVDIISLEVPKRSGKSMREPPLCVADRLDTLLDPAMFDCPPWVLFSRP
jgi:hypothetical protein